MVPRTLIQRAPCRSRALLSTFEFKDVLIRKEKTIEGKKKIYYEKVAVEDYALSQTETNTPGGEG